MVVLGDLGAGRSRKATPPEGGAQRQVAEIAVPMFGYKNHLGIDHGHGFIRRFSVTHAARHDGISGDGCIITTPESPRCQRAIA
jgi:hypothetical protein